ncbi:MAG: hypothetical protein L0170_00425 [Acidobacteria bacterium]|nr:hypothetical protein [Acidobacteriota bacterium]
MDHLIRPASESMFPAADVLLNFPRCVQALDAAVRETLARLWDEPFRKRAHALAQSMSDGCKVCGFKESSGLLRSLESLLALTAEDTRGIQRSAGERMLDILSLLKEQARLGRRELLAPDEDVVR